MYYLPFKTYALAGALSLTALSLTAQEVVKTTAIGDGIYESAYNAKNQRLYVTSIGDKVETNGQTTRVRSGVFVLNPKTMKVVDSILLPKHPPFGLALNTATQTLYTSNTVTNSVTAVNLKTDKITLIKGDENTGQTREIIVDETQNLVYVTDVSKDSKIWVIDGKTNQLLYTINHLGKTVTGMAFSADKSKIFITVMGDNAIGVVDLAQKKLVNTFPSGGESPINIVRDGQRLFVTNQRSNTLTVLSVDGKLIKSVAVGKQPVGVYFDPVKERVYTANRSAGTVSIIDADTYQVIDELATGTHPNHIDGDAQGVAYVLNKAKRQKRNAETPVQKDVNGDTVSKIKS